MNTIQIEFSFDPYMALVESRYCYNTKTGKPITEQDILSSKKSVNAYKKAIQRVIANGTISLEDCYDDLINNLPNHMTFVFYKDEDPTQSQPMIEYFENHVAIVVPLIQAIADDTLIYKNRQWQKIEK